MKDDAQVTEMIESLEKLAGRVLNLKRTSIPRRPIVLEFCGSPKAGKTSCLNALGMFLRRNGFRVKVLVERASVCPVDKKYDPLFNVWTVCSALAELSEILSNSPKEYDVLILDRGVFDALCWFQWQYDHRYLDKDSLNRIADFLTMKKWRSAIDLVLIFEASPEVSIDREYAALLTRKRGSIMREPILASYLKAIGKARATYGGRFREIEVFDTSNKSQNDVSFEVSKMILERLEASTAEAVGHFPVTRYLSGAFDGVVDFGSNVFPVDDEMCFAPRPKVEQDSAFVQPIPILVITNPERTRVLAAKKNKKAAQPGSPEFDKTLLYFGGHTRWEDSLAAGKNDILSVCKAALTRELKEEIGVDFCPEDLMPSFVIWEKDNDRSEKHMAVCFVWETDPDALQITMDRNEFAVSGATATFSSVSNVKSAELESWSKAILSKVFNMQTDQQALPL